MKSWTELHRLMISGRLPSPWQQLLMGCLVPLGWIYGFLGQIRVALYRLGLLTSYRAPVPVVSVGNLSSGGTGKTPMVDHLVRTLQQRGRKVAVVSRGYRGTFSGVAAVNPQNAPWLAPETCGDEPFLLACRNPGVPVLVSARRAEGIRRAIDEFDVDVVVLDDAFQHLSVRRDLDIVLLDAARPLGNGRVLPAGVLREFPSALDRADLLVLTRSTDITTNGTFRGKQALRCRHRLADEIRSLSGETVSITSLAGRKGLAFAGIADPQGFFAALSESGLELNETIALADHAHYDRATLERLALSAREADFLVTTEKDGVKLRAGQFAVPCYQVPVTLDFSTTASLDDALELLFR